MIRFFVAPSQIHGLRFTLQGSEAHHAIHVHRKKAGDTIDLFDGVDRAFRGRIESIDGDEVRGTLIENQTAAAWPMALTLFQAIIKGPRWDWLLQKACEIGVHRIVPLTTARTVVKVDAESSAGKLERWNRIALEASKQCGRSAVMTVESPSPFDETLLRHTPNHLSIIPWEKEDECRIAEAVSGFQGRTAGVYIGPEGGWDPKEIERAQQAGVVPVRLGPTLLRSETAGLIASVLVLKEVGLY